jgi:hypothetical protein
MPKPSGMRCRRTSPDTLVPDPTNVFDYNRYAYARLNPLKYNDPSGHQASCMLNADGSWDCNPHAVIGGLTVDLDETYEQPPCQHLCGDPAVVLGGLFIGSMLAPFASAYGPALLATAAASGAGRAAISATTAACGDGDCQNEISAVCTCIRTGSIFWPIDPLHLHHFFNDL